MNYRNLCRLIEDLCLEWEDSDLSSKTAQHLFDHIYRLAHLAGSCVNGHPDWQRQARQEMSKLRDLRKERWELMELCQKMKAGATDA